MAIGIALASAFFAGLTTILAKIGVKHTDSTVATAIRTVVVLFFSIIMVLIVGSQATISEISSKTWLFLILSGTATGLSWLCYFKALQLGEVNKVTPIDKSSTVLTILLAFVLLDEPISLWRILALVLYLIGTLLMVQKKQSTGETKSQSWIIYAILSAVFASLTSILGKIGISGVESNLGTAIRTAVVLVLAFLMVFVSGKRQELKTLDKKDLGFIIASGFTTGASWLCFYFALQIGEASIVVPIDKLSIIFTMAFSAIFLKETFRKKELLGLALILIATFLLVFG